MAYASHFPADCPPSAASPVDHTVYRIVENHPFIESEFLTKYEENSEDWNNCQARGLSVFTDIEDLKRIYRRVKGACGNSFLAKAELTGNVGCILNTPFKRSGRGSHHTWWIDDACDRMAAFKLDNAPPHWEKS